MSEKVFDGGLVQGNSVVIGIDPSLTGFAMAAVDLYRPDQYEIWVYKSPYKGVRRLEDIRWWMNSKFDLLEQELGNFIEAVAVEGTVVQSHSASVLGELSGVVKLALFQRFSEDEPRAGLPLQIPPMTLKKFVTGKGNSKKQEMLLKTYQNWKVELSDDNAADAYGLARIATNKSDNAVQKEILEKIQNGDYRDK